MFRAFAVVFLMVVMAAQAGQAPTGISQRYKPGDTLRYTVAFDGDPNFASLAIVFQKRGPVEPSQTGLSAGFGISYFAKRAPGVFNVEGKIPPTTATGIYDLVEVDTGIAPSGSHSYDTKKFGLTISVENDQKYEFPPLKSVTPN